MAVIAQDAMEIVSVCQRYLLPCLEPTYALIQFATYDGRLVDAK
jgi:hypothetical protein